MQRGITRSPVSAFDGVGPWTHCIASPCFPPPYHHSVRQPGKKETHEHRERWIISPDGGVQEHQWDAHSILTTPQLTSRTPRGHSMTPAGQPTGHHAPDPMMIIALPSASHYAAPEAGTKHQLTDHKVSKLLPLR